MHQSLKRKLTNFVLVVISLVLLSTSIEPSSLATAVTNTPASTTTILTATPIKHIVVIFQENGAFDHYFGTYPNAENPPKEPVFVPHPKTPSVNGLAAGLLSNNTNLANPYRLDRSQAVTVASCDPTHKYTPLQKSLDAGLMDKFV